MEKRKSSLAVRLLNGSSTAALVLAVLSVIAACAGCSKPAAAPLVVTSAAPSATPDSALRRIVVTAKQFEFTPDTLELVEQEEVLLDLRSLDRTHGFSIFELGVSVQILPDRPTLLRFKPPRPGTFTYACSVECGSGHEQMNGTLVVKPRRPAR
jgi:nitrous oxide reductase